MSESNGSHILTTPAHIDPRYCGKTLPGMRTKIDKPDENGEGEVSINRNLHLIIG